VLDSFAVAAERLTSIAAINGPVQVFVRAYQPGRHRQGVVQVRQRICAFGSEIRPTHVENGARRVADQWCPMMAILRKAGVRE
jgi:hypothetical protein